MAARKPEAGEELTFVAPVKEEVKEITVQVYLPKLEEEGGGVKVDQYEHVTLANQDKEETFYIRRGERIDVPVRVFAVLKEKYPDL